MYNDDIIFDDSFFFTGIDSLKEYSADNLTEDDLRELQEYYKDIFGYIPDYKDYSCTRTEYNFALFKALDEKKELSEYLQKRTQSEE